MTISVNDIHSYLKLTFPTLSSNKLKEKEEKFKKSFDENTINKEDYFLVRNEKGVPIAASWIFSIEAGNYAFQSPKFQLKDSSVLRKLFEQVKERFTALEGKTLICRTVHDELHDFLKDEMQKFDFQVTGDRLEYKTLIKDINTSSWGSSPLRWAAPLENELMSLDEVASFMETVAIGDPNYDPEVENAKDCIESYFCEEGLYVEKDCVQVGYLNGMPCAFIIAQVEPSSGWSRITYMGVHQDFRKQGLGTWVQRHGIQLLIEQGGKEYHGGTSFNNKGMQRVFEKNGCKLFRKLTEWKLI